MRSTSTTKYFHWRTEHTSSNLRNCVDLHRSALRIPRSLAHISTHVHTDNAWFRTLCASTGTFAVIRRARRLRDRTLRLFASSRPSLRAASCTELGSWCGCSMADQACGSNYEAPIRLINKEASRSHRLVGLQRVAASLGRRCHVRRSRALHCRWLQWSHQRLGVRNLTVRPSSRWRVKLSCCPGRWRLPRLRRKLLALRLVLSGLRQYRLSRLLWRRVVLTDLVLRWAELSDLLWRRVRLPGLLWWRVRLPGPLWWRVDLPGLLWGRDLQPLLMGSCLRSLLLWRRILRIPPRTRRLASASSVCDSESTSAPTAAACASAATACCTSATAVDAALKGQEKSARLESSRLLLLARAARAHAAARCLRVGIGVARPRKNE